MFVAAVLGWMAWVWVDPAQNPMQMSPAQVLGILESGGFVRPEAANAIWHAFAVAAFFFFSFGIPVLFVGLAIATVCHMPQVWREEVGA